MHGNLSHVLIRQAYRLLVVLRERYPDRRDQVGEAARELNAIADRCADETTSVAETTALLDEWHAAYVRRIQPPHH
jgi:hypothetical protein